MRIKMLPSLFLFTYMRFVLFVRVKCYGKKKKFKIALMTSFTLLLICRGELSVER